MTARRRARELAVQFLYSLEVNPGELEERLADFWAMVNVPEKVNEFASSLVRGATEQKERIDSIISDQAINWDIQRITLVDKNVLRLAVYELLFREDIPPVVSINEAVDIAKKFGTPESGKFVNGILDNVKAKLAGVSK
jgi:N utilization substance protein B